MAFNILVRNLVKYVNIYEKFFSIQEVIDFC